MCARHLCDLIGKYCIFSSARKNLAVEDISKHGFEHLNSIEKEVSNLTIRGRV